MSTLIPPFILLTPEEMREAEAIAIAGGIASAALMERAGGTVADQIIKAMSARPALVACGPGNNGGDGFVIARRLKDAGWPVRVGLFGKREALTGDPAMMADLFDGNIEPLQPALLEGTGLVIDALFGIGLSRPIEGELADFVKATNAHVAPVFAIDIPSGIDAGSGAVLGAAVRANTTFTFATKKPGHLLFPGRAFCGGTAVVDIDLPAEAVRRVGPKLAENGPGLWGGAFPRPRFDQHKYDRGHAAVVAGPKYMTGAARLAARGALRAGAGLVSIFADDGAADVIAPVVTSVMVKLTQKAEAITEALGDQRFSVALIGPGLGVSDEAKQKVNAVLGAPQRVVLDADGLSNFESTANELFASLSVHDVITPHEGEFFRLFPDEKPTSGTHFDKLASARRAAQKAGTVIVLKGADTVIASPDGRTAINGNAPADLATAGAGDVLAGFIAGLMAQGMPTFEAACAGVWLHGGCGQVGGPGLIAEDLPDLLPQVLRALMAPPKKQQETAASNVAGHPGNGDGGNRDAAPTQHLS
ncbi:MAG: NAD(P)H-hydrate dehydratase [Pseudomonadota bacterium]